MKRIKKLCTEKALKKRFFKRMSVAMKLRDMHSEFLISILNCRSLFAISYINSEHIPELECAPNFREIY